MTARLDEALRSTILIVDDDPTARDALKMLLHPEGHELVAATSGQEALVFLDDPAPDVILLDVMMPGFVRVRVAGDVFPVDPKKCKCTTLGHLRVGVRREEA